MNFLRPLGFLFFALSTAHFAHPSAGPVDTLKSVSFRGAIGTLPIWMDLQIPKSNGKVTGSYFYQRYGKAIQLSGEIKDTVLLLKEIHKNKVTGDFDLNFSKMDMMTRPWLSPRLDDLRIMGTWKKPGKRTTIDAFGYQIDPDHKLCFQINPDSLLLTSGESFGMEMKTYAEANYQSADGPSEKPIDHDYEITNCGNGIFSAVFSWYAAYGSQVNRAEAMVHHTFDLSRKTEINLWEEVDSTKSEPFRKQVAKSLDPLLAEIRSRNPDSLWKSLLWVKLENASDKNKTLNDIFKVTPQSNPSFYLKNDTLMVGASNYFDISPPERDELDLRYDEVFAPVLYPDIKKYLKKNSVLHNLARTKK